jgi:RNA polymerase sigma-70 factor (ECF subfamily)
MSDRDPRAPDLDSTASLLARIREGSDDARERLFARVLPVLQRWAHRRLPDRARDMLDTDDLVQVTLLRALVRLDSFEWRGEGAFLAYLRQVLLNAIRERIRRASRRPDHVGLDETVLDQIPEALQAEAGGTLRGDYEPALAALSDEAREAVLMRFEFDYSYAEIAQALKKPSPDAARMIVQRALDRLSGRIGEP